VGRKGNAGGPGASLAVVVFLIATAVLISYIDRGNLSIAAPALKLELGLTASQLGLLLSAFFWSYTVMLFASAFLIDRTGNFRVAFTFTAGICLLGALFWSLCVGEFRTTDWARQDRQA
jgi:sugar phosphate permease